MIDKRSPESVNAAIPLLEKLSKDAPSPYTINCACSLRVSGITNNKGQVLYGWRISGNADPGQFKVTVDATKAGYVKGSATSTFTVTPKPGA